ncbi:MAG: Flagellar M-ring protein FliF [Micavibrio sp.]|nr:Flagellar M-ring protein FliF [Micavibrio sp.]
MDTLKQLGPARIAIMGGVFVGLLMFFIFVSMQVATPQLKLLYSNLSSTDSASVAAKLEEAKIRYDVSTDGTKVMVPESEVGRARVLLAKAGLPNGGSMGYEIFDQQSGFGTTNFIQNINQVRALEGELSRTIGAVEGVRSARVHLVLPERQLFSRDSRPASASVFIALNPNARFSSDQIAAVQHLVASAVPDLKPTNVSIIDNTGNMLARGGDDDNTMMSMKSEEMRRSYEVRMTQAVEDMVGRVVGYGRVRATVNADLNFDRVAENTESYDPNQQVVRSTQTTEEKNTERAAASGDVSVQNNLPGIAGDLSGGKPTAEGSKTQETTNYEITKTVRSLTKDVGEVKKLSIAVLVDGTYTTEKDKDGKEVKDGKKTYAPRSDEEVKRIEDLVKSAVGFDEARGDKIQVANMQFADVDVGSAGLDKNLLFGFERSDLLRAAEIIAVAIMIILVVLLVLQPMVNRLLATETGAEGEDSSAPTGMLPGRMNSPALIGPSGDSFEPPIMGEDDAMIDMKSVEGKVKASAVRKVEDIVETYPNETVAVIRGWMSQES